MTYVPICPDCGKVMEVLVQTPHCPRCDDSRIEKALAAERAAETAKQRKKDCSGDCDGCTDCKCGDKKGGCGGCGGC